MVNNLKKYVLSFFRAYHRIMHSKIELDIISAYECLNTYRKNNYRKSRIIRNPIKEEVDLSIIVPIYNVEKYLMDCISSITEQETEYTIEVILVNDGSTDNSGEILKSFNNEQDIKIIYQKNQGLSSARNTGLEHAVGKYVMFVDSDDVIYPETVQKLMNEAYKQNADIVEGGYSIFPHGQVCSKEYKFVARDNIEEKLKRSGYAWGKVYKRTLFEKVQWPPGLLFEDTLNHLILFYLANTIITIPDVIYGYRVNDTGIMHTYMKDYKGIDAYWVVEALLQKRAELGIPMDTYMYKFLIYQLSVMTYSKVRFYEDKIIDSIFVLCCELIRKIKIKDVVLNRQQQILEQAFLHKNKRLWEVCSRIDFYENKLLQ